MIEDSVRSIAADASVISIALLAVNLILISLAWKGFNRKFASLPGNERGEIVKRSFITLIAILILVGIITAVGVNSPQFIQVSYFLAFLGFTVILVLYLIISEIQHLISYLRRRKSESSIIKVDSVTYMYFNSMLILGTSIFCAVFALFGIIDTALAININPDQAKNFLWSKWLLLDSVIFFTIGIFATGYSFLSDKSRKWKTEN